MKQHFMHGSVESLWEVGKSWIYVLSSTPYHSCKWSRMVGIIRRIEDKRRRCELEIIKWKKKILVVDGFKILQLTGTLNAFKTINRFICLESVISNSRIYKVKVKHRIRITKSPGRMHWMWKDHSITATTKMRPFRGQVLPFRELKTPTRLCFIYLTQTLDFFGCTSWREDAVCP